MIVDWLNRGRLRSALLTALLCLAWLLACVLYASGCGASQAQQHARLNALTSIADPTYDEAVELCDRLRDLIVEREGTTYAEDRAAMDEVHAVCDPMVAGFEALRASQLTARGAIDSGLGGAGAAAVSAALELWPDALALVERLRSQIGGE